MRQYHFTLLLFVLSSIALGAIAPPPSPNHNHQLPSNDEAALDARHYGQYNPRHWRNRWEPGQLYMLCGNYQENYGATFLKPDSHDDPNNPGSLLVAMIVELAYNKAIFTIPVSYFVQTQHNGLVYRVMSVPAGDVQVYPHADWASEFQLSLPLVDYLLDQFWPVGCEAAESTQELQLPAQQLPAQQLPEQPVAPRSLRSHKIRPQYKDQYPEIGNNIFYVLGRSIEHPGKDVVAVLTLSRENMEGKKVIDADQFLSKCPRSVEYWHLPLMVGQGYGFYRDEVTQGHHEMVETGSSDVPLPVKSSFGLSNALYPERNKGRGRAKPK